ncbi:hypothetical protein Lal_00041260, partial [Lupinus albus]
HLTTKHKNNTHLKNNTKGITYIVSTEFLEALSTIPTLKQERIPHCSLTQFLFEVPSLSCKYDWRLGF